ncbi:MAG: dihydrodipicolinate reductase C-terminal domain-containing protein, partial [Methanopyri archaeon]|nr:dihydrodipicolinate reductase C-terminal domain-containing protein [Methanopyri archaeon]
HLARIAARFFDYADVYEAHHEAKIDAPSGTAMKLARDIAGVRVLSLPTAFPMSPPVKLLVVDETDVCIVAGDFDEERLTDVMSVHYQHLSTINRIIRRIHANLHKLPFAKVWGL